MYQNAPFMDVRTGWHREHVLQLFHKFVLKVPLISLHCCLFACEGTSECMCSHFLNTFYVLGSLYLIFVYL